MDITTVLTTFLETVIVFLPKLVGTLILLVIGWIVGYAIGRATKELMIRLKIDRYVTGKAKPTIRLSGIFSTVFSWAIYLAFIWAAVGYLEIAALNTLMEVIVMQFIPGLLKAAIITIVGYVLAEYIRDKIETSKVMYSELMGKAVFFLIIYLALAVGLPQVGIDLSLVNNMLLIIVGGFGIGLAIAVGLGLKDTVAALAKKYQKKLK